MSELDQMRRKLGSSLDGTLSPEVQIQNVADALVNLLEGPAHSYRMAAARSSAKQLQEMLVRYFAKELPPLKDDGLAF